MLHRARPSSPSGQSVCGRRDAPKRGRGRHGWRLAQSRACLISAYPFFVCRTHPSPACRVNKRTSADKGPAKISPRGPFRGNQCKFADFFFSAARLAGLKKSRLSDAVSYYQLGRGEKPSAALLPRLLIVEVSTAMLIKAPRACWYHKNFRSWKCEGMMMRNLDIYLHTNLQRSRDRNITK